MSVTPAARVRPVDPARVVALDALIAIRERGSYANLVMSEVTRRARLSTRDAGFATELVYGTTRQRDLLDAVLAQCVDRPLEQLDPAVLDVLRLGAYQHLMLGTPAHAAVGESVELTAWRIGPGPEKLVNAVLRRVTERDVDTWIDIVAPDAAQDPIGFLALARSHPRWIVEALAQALGTDDLAELEDLLVANNSAAPVTLVARPSQATVEELLVERGTSPGRWSPYAVTLAGRAPGSIEAIRTSRAGVQDEGSQLVALAFSRAAVDGSDSRWLDVCAGPGGKAALLAALLASSGSAGAHLIAGDRALHRARLVASATAQLPVSVVVADGVESSWQPGAFDRALVDAPCTGLGSLRRRPDSRWRRSPDDVRPLVALQRQLLRGALDSVRIGGVVGYATCSPLRAETVDVVDAVLADPTIAAERLDATALLPELSDLGSGPDVRLWPHRHETDGMYLALLRRTPITAG